MSAGLSLPMSPSPSLNEMVRKAPAVSLGPVRVKLKN